MSKKINNQVDDFFILTKAVLIDLPLAGIQWQWGLCDETTMTKAAWTGYDAGVRFATATVDNLYRLPLTTTLLKNAAPAFLRWQYLSNAVIGAVLVGVWNTVGLPTTRETQALREDIARLTADVHQQRQEQETLISVATRVVQALEAETPLALSAAVNGFVLTESLAQPKTSANSH